MSPKSFVEVRGQWGRGGDKEGRGDNRGHLAQAACTALPPGACPKGTLHNNIYSENKFVGAVLNV